jgi:hypothetical protein
MLSALYLAYDRGMLGFSSEAAKRNAVAISARAAPVDAGAAQRIHFESHGFLRPLIVVAGIAQRPLLARHEAISKTLGGMG